MNENNTKRIIELAAAEGHDADIPSNAGTLPHNVSRRGTTSPSPTEMGSTNLEKDVEKEGASRGVSTRTTPIPSLHGDSKLEVEVEEQDDPNVVDWDGHDDPENPLNWSNKRKWAAIGMVSMVTFLTPLGSSVFAPGVPLVMDEFHSNSQILEGFVVSVYVLGFAFGPLSKSHLIITLIVVTPGILASQTLIWAYIRHTLTHSSNCSFIRNVWPLTIVPCFGLLFRHLQHRLCCQHQLEPIDSVSILCWLVWRRCEHSFLVHYTCIH